LVYISRERKTQFVNPDTTDN